MPTYPLHAVRGPTPVCCTSRNPKIRNATPRPNETDSATPRPMKNGNSDGGGAKLGGAGHNNMLEAKAAAEATTITTAALRFEFIPYFSPT
jgi:hypothetical protein